MRVRPLQSIDEITPYLAEREPMSTNVLAPLLSGGLGRDFRAWVLDRPGSGPVGALVLERLSLDRWTASVMLDEPSDAPAFGPLLQRSPAWNVSGPAATIHALSEFVPRMGPVLDLWLYAFEPLDDVYAEAGAMGLSAADAVRQADLGDLDDLVRLYTGFEDIVPMTRGALRGYLRRKVAEDRVAVVGSPGELQGGEILMGQSSRYRLHSHLTVRPEYRGRGISVSLFLWLAKRAYADGLGMTGIRGAANGMRVRHQEVADHHSVSTDVYATASLAPPARVRGMGRARKHLNRIRGGNVTGRTWAESPHSQRPTG